MGFMMQNKKKFILQTPMLMFLSLLIIIFLLFAILTPNSSFIRIQNIGNIFTDMVIPAIFALGMGIIFSAGGFDLSLGHIASVSALTTAYMMSPAMSYTPGFSIFTGLVFAAVIGLISGLIVSRLGVSSFIVTLGMQFVIIGVRQVITRGQSVYISHAGFKQLAAKPLGISNMIIILIVIALICYVFMEKTTIGRKIQFVGDNIDASEYKGINVRNLTMLTFIIGAVLAAFAGILFSARAGAVQINSVDSKLLEAITIAVFSSVLFGKYNTVGIILVAFLISMIGTGMSMMGIRAEWVEFVKGFIIIISIMLSKVSNYYGMVKN